MNTEVEENFIKKKKIILTAIIASVILFVIILLLLMYFNYRDSLKTKYIFNDTTYALNFSEVDGTDMTKGSINYNNSNYDLFCVDGEDYYFNIDTLCKLTGYEYKKGEYSPVSENSDKCYIINEGEYSSYSLDSNIVKKQLYNADKSSSKSDVLNDEKEFYTIDKNVRKIDNQLYASADGISVGFNMQVTSNGNNIVMYSLPYLIEGYQKVATNKEYDGVSSDFKNQRALAKELIVVQENNKYGVYSAKDDTEVISTKYDDLEYVGNINQFIGTFSGKMGMLSIVSEEPTIDIDYDSIKLLDAEDILYLVSKENKYGIISGEGKIIVPIEYDDIGLDDLKDFSKQNIDNNYIFFDELIVVSSNNKYGFYSKNGDVLKEVQYDSLGCTNASEVVQSQSSNMIFENTLVINYSDEKNQINGIVFCLNGKYGIIQSNGDILVPAEWDSVFYIRNGENVEYYMASSDSGTVMRLNDYLNLR